MNRTATLVLMVLTTASCGTGDQVVPKQSAAPSGRGSYTLAGVQQWSRPGSWRQVVTGSPEGVFVAAISTDRYGTRVVIPRPPGLDVWQADLDCRAGGLSYRQSVAIRDGAQTKASLRVPPPLDRREVAKLCGGGTSLLVDGTPEQAADAVGRLPAIPRKE